MDARIVGFVVGGLLTAAASSLIAAPAAASTLYSQGVEVDDFDRGIFR